MGFQGFSLLFICLATTCILAIRSAGAAEPPDEWAAVKASAEEVLPQNRETRDAEDPKPSTDSSSILVEYQIQVVDADSGKPLAGARINSMVPGDDWHQIPIRRAGNDGRYIFRGRWAKPSPGAASTTVNLSLAVSAPGYCSQSLILVLANVAAASSLENSKVVRLGKGLDIGGIVKNESGQPVAGAKVTLQGSDLPQNVFQNPNGKWVEFPGIDLTGDSALVTDASGKWVCHNFPSNLLAVQISLTTPEGGEANYGTRIDQFGMALLPVELDDLKAMKAVFQIHPGTTIVGTVVDEAGKPVPAADVWEGHGFQGQFPIVHFHTDAEGRFKRLNRAKRQWIYSATAEGKATASAIVDAFTNPVPARIVLPAARPLKISVVDENKKPIPGLALNAPMHKNQGQVLTWAPITAADGTVVWANRPLTKLSLMFIKDGVPRYTAVKTNETEKTIVVRNMAEMKANVSIRAADADTGAAVKMSKVLLQVQPWLPVRPLAEPQAASASVSVAQSDLQGQESFSLQVLADGYVPQTLSELSLEEGDFPIDLKLQKSVPLVLKILNPDGSPAAGISCWVKTRPSQQPLYLSTPDQVWGAESFDKVVADQDGQATLPPAGEEAGVVAYSDQGIASATVGVLRTNNVIKLVAMAVVEGDFWAGTNATPKARQLALNPVTWEAGRLYMVQLSTEPDSKSHFRFNRVPPGEYHLIRYHSRMGMLTPSHPQKIVVAAGKTNYVKYGGNGRAVTGQALADPEDVPVNWANDDHKLELRAAGGSTSSKAGPQDFATVRAYQKAMSGAGAVQGGPPGRTYVLDFNEDGSFRDDDVLPGKYNLNITVTKTKKRQEDYWNTRPEDQLGKLEKIVEIPEGAGETDLGTVTVPIHASGGGPALGPLDLTGLDLSGHPWDIKSLHGKTVVLGLWATWSGHSAEFFKEWAALIAEYGKSGEVVFVGLDLAEDASAVKKTVADRGYAWQQVLFTGKPAAQFLDRYEIGELPCCMLVTPDGKTKATQLDNKRLAAALKRLATRK